MDFFDTFENDRYRHKIIENLSKIPSNYVGSKRRLLLSIWDMLEKHNVKFDSVTDAFSGSAIVSMLFKIMGKKVVCNDLLTSSAITAVCLMENNSLPLTKDDIHFLCTNIPETNNTFVTDNYKDKFFTERECLFLDRYKANMEKLCGPKFYCGMDVLNKATLSSIPNCNFSLGGKNIKNLRSAHDLNTPFYKEKWRDTTRKRRDANNEIMFDSSINEMCDKYKSAFALFAVEHHINQNCFVGGRYYNGQTIAKVEHRIKHEKNNGLDLTEKSMTMEHFKSLMINGDAIVFNSDIIDLLDARLFMTDLIYLDPPYGGASSDYAMLYSFLEEYLYEDKMSNLEHIQKGGKRFNKAKGYEEHFCELLDKCKDFPNILLSYNESSFADIDTIVSMVRNSGRSNIEIEKIDITYQYRKNKNMVDVDHFTNNFANDGHKYSQRGTEYLILIR